MEKNSKAQFIYSLNDPITNEIRYIGKTGNIEDRYKRHLQKCYLDKYDKNTHKSNWIKSLLKMGLKPILNIIQECNTENVNELEVYWISKFKKDGIKLTNSSMGGEVGVDWTGKHHTNESKEKIRKSKEKYRIPVIEYDLSGKILNRYNSLMDASDKSGHHIYLISNCCKKRGSYTVGGGKFWRESSEKQPSTFRYENDIFDYVPYNKNMQINSKKVCKYDLFGKFIEIYESVRSASQNNNTSKSNITSCCRRKINKKTGKFIIVKGYTWRYYDETLGNDLI